MVEFQTVWQTLPHADKMARGQALLDRETGYAVYIDDYRLSTRQYVVRFTYRTRTMLVPRDQMIQRFSGLVPMELLRKTLVYWRDPEPKEANLTTCPSHIWNRWFFLHLIGGDPTQIPSKEKTPFERRIELSSWLWNHQDVTLEAEYQFTAPRSR